MKKTNPQILILLGRSGSGKGTQAKFLIRDYKYEYISTGDVLRKRAQKNDFTGKKIKKMVEHGVLVPRFLVSSIWSEEIGYIRDNKKPRGIVIDGSPRRLEEAQVMDKIFEWLEWDNIKVLLIDISRQEAFDRLTKRRICKMCGQLIPYTSEFKDMKVCNLCGGQLVERPDDKPAAIKARLDFYTKDVEPAVKYYQKTKRLIKINGEKSIEDVYDEIKTKLTK